MEHWPEYTRFFTALLVILDPFAAIPVLLSLTRHYTTRERGRTVTLTAITVAAVLSLAALFGERMLTILGTSLASFRVGGGIILLLMSLSMLRAQPDQLRATPEERAAAGPENVAVVPLGIPLLAGPGAISTVIIEMHRPGAEYHLFWVLAVILAITLSLWMVLRLASPIGRLLGKLGLNILNRLFGLVLAAIAVEIMANGLRDLFPALGA